MSNDEWERGELVLPPKDAKRIRAALNDEHENRRAAIAKEVEGFLAAKGMGGKTAQTFEAVLERWYGERSDRLEDANRGWGFQSDQAVAANEVARDALQEAYDFLSGRAHSGQLGRPTAKELKAAFPPAPKSGRVVYRLGEPSITLDGNKLYWRVPENNHAVEMAHDHPMARRLFAELGKVQWVKGTGGTFRANNEYNEDSGREYAGAGGSYETAAYGPLGDPHFATPAQAAAVKASAQRWRAKSPANAGKCGERTLVNGRQTGAPCKNSAYGCPVHGRRRSRW